MFMDVIKKVKFMVLFGVFMVKGLFLKEVFEEMGKINERLIIMLFLNLMFCVECMVEDVVNVIDGRVIFLFGLLFSDVEINGRVMKVN